MKNLKKSALCVALLCFLGIGLLFAQGQKISQDPIKTTPFVDDLGREIEVPEKITKLAPAGNPANVVLLTIRPELMVGLSEKPADTHYFGNKLNGIPEFGAFYGKKANLNKEAVINAAPQIIIDIGEIKGSTSDMSADLNNLQKTLGIPIVFVENYLKNSAQTYRTLGALLNEEQRGEELALYSEEAIAFANKVRSQIKSPKTYYFSESADGLEGLPKNSFKVEVFELLGANNIVEKSISNGSNQISLEQILLKNPDYVFLSDPQAFNLVTSPNSPWRHLNAVKNKHVYLVPKNLYGWIADPPSINRLLGIYYVAGIMYPEIAKVNIREEAKKYYKLFYNYNLKDSEIKL